MREEIFYVSDDYAENLIKQYTGHKRQKMIDDLKSTLRILKFYTNNDFAFMFFDECYCEMIEFYLSPLAKILSFSQKRNFFLKITFLTIWISEIRLLPSDGKTQEQEQLRPRGSIIEG